MDVCLLIFPLTSNRDIARSLVVSCLSELLDPAGVLAGVVRLGLTDGQATLALVHGDEEPNVGLAHLIRRIIINYLLSAK
jgi:hypothetical protein